MSQLTMTELRLVDTMSSALAGIYGQLEPTVVTDAPDPGPRRVPRPLRLWLARLRLLEAVPFSHLVADSALLPPESIRFFHLDRGWTDALIEGALSVGTVTTADRAVLDRLYPVIRAEVDEAERLVRLPGWTPGAQVPTGEAGPITGFLLRSRMVSGWPALSVRAYGVDNLAPGSGRPKKRDAEVDISDEVALEKLPLLRFERLAPAVLLVIMDGLPRVIHVEEPRAGIQFGVDQADAPAGRTAMTARLRDIRTADPILDGANARTVAVPFRKGAPGVIHMAALMKKFVDEPATHVADAPDAAAFAMQMLQFPWRSVYGDQNLAEPGSSTITIRDLFRPKIGYAELAQRFEDGPSAFPISIPGVNR